MPVPCNLGYRVSRKGSLRGVVTWVEWDRKGCAHTGRLAVTDASHSRAYSPRVTSAVAPHSSSHFAASQGLECFPVAALPRPR